LSTSFRQVDVLTRREAMGVAGVAAGSALMGGLGGCGVRGATAPERRTTMHVVRISSGHFDASACEDIERTLREGGDRLVPHIRRLAGCIHYYAAINRETNTIVNVSVWDSLEHAEQMGTLKAMQDEGVLMRSKGVQFNPIVNYESVWTITG
jgi:quinol monooxygenase YgiN